MKQGLLFRTFYNTGAQIAGRILSGLLAFLLTLIVAKALGAEGYGEYTKILSYLAFFYILTDFGLNTIFLRDYGTRIPVTFPAFLGLRFYGSFLLAVLACLLMVGISLLVPGWSGVLGSVAIGSVSIVGFGLFLSISAVFQMQKRYTYIAAMQIIGAAVALGSLFFLPPPPGVQKVMLAVVLGWWSSALSGLILLRRPALMLPRFDLQLWRNICLFSLPLGVTLVLNTVYFRADTFILATFKTSSEVGAYGLAYKFFEIALILPAFIMNSLYPEFLETRVDETQVRRRFSSIWKTFLILSLFVGCVVWIVAPLMVYIKTDFADSIIYLRMLAFSLPFFYLTSPLMWFYVLLKKQGRLVIVYGLSLVFNIALNLTLVPKYGASAASIVTGMTEVVVLVLGLYFMQRS